MTHLYQEVVLILLLELLSHDTLDAAGRSIRMQVDLSAGYNIMDLSLISVEVVLS